MLAERKNENVYHVHLLGVRASGLSLNLSKGPRCVLERNSLLAQPVLNGFCSKYILIVNKAPPKWLHE